MPLVAGTIVSGPRSDNAAFVRRGQITSMNRMNSGTFNQLHSFFQKETTPGLLLFGAAVLALVIENSSLYWLYDALLSTPVTIQVGALEIAKPLLLWINDGLMALFFFVVGLEIKREVITGELSSIDKAVLPFLAAVGGIAAPSLIYATVAWDDPVALTGWAIPAATDIAFALGILAVLGSRVPVALKVFLLSVAVIDDLGAILIIATFYTENLSFTSLLLGTLGISALVIMNRAGVRTFAPYAIVGAAIWVCFLKSGVHATLAGVLIALTIPLGSKGAESPSLLHKLEHDLHPWIAFLVLPVFAFANAGVPLSGLSFEALMAPIPLGIILGLVIGKQLGVFGAAWLAVKFGLAKLPAGVSWRDLYGVACLTGVGFTMSLFVGTLAFDTAEQLNQVRLGVLAGSVVSGLLGYLILRSSLSMGRNHSDPAPDTTRASVSVDAMRTKLVPNMSRASETVS